MSHLVVQGPYVPDRYGLGYEFSPRTRRVFGYNPALQNSPRPFRKPGLSLPRWLNFKTSNNETAQNKLATSAQSSVNNGERTEIPDRSASESSASEKSTSESTSERNASEKKTSERRSSIWSVRSSKSTSSGLRKKIQEHKMNTNTGEWKKELQYNEVRQRRKLLEKQKNRMLRRIKRFYWPSIFFIVLGGVFILGSTVSSIGGGTVYWKFKDQFRISGPIFITIGVIMLLVTVGFENQSSERWKKRGVTTNTNPLIHPDFFNKPDVKRRISEQSSASSFDEEMSQLRKQKRRISEQSSASSFDEEMSQLRKQSVGWRDTHRDDKSSFFSSSIGSTSSATSLMRKSESEDLQFDRTKLKDLSLDDEFASLAHSHHASSSQRLASSQRFASSNRHFSSQCLMSKVNGADIPVEQEETLEFTSEDEVFLFSTMTHSASDLNGQKRFSIDVISHRPWERATGSNNDSKDDIVLSYNVGKIEQEDNKAEVCSSLMGDGGGNIRAPRVEAENDPDDLSYANNGVSGPDVSTGPAFRLTHNNLKAFRRTLSTEDDPLLKSDNIHLKSDGKEQRFSEVSILLG